MGYIPKKTLEDLEYDEVLKRCSNFSITSLGKVEIMNLHPKTQTDEIINGLNENEVENLLAREKNNFNKKYI